MILAGTIWYLYVAFVQECLIWYWDFEKVSLSVQRFGTSELTFLSNRFFSQLLKYYSCVIFVIFHEIKAHHEKRLIFIGSDESNSHKDIIQKQDRIHFFGRMLITQEILYYEMYVMQLYGMAL